MSQQQSQNNTLLASETAAAPSRARAEARAAGITLTFDGAAPARFRLLWDEAPETCAAVMAALPAGADAFHASYSGTIAAFVIEATVVAPLENATTCVLPGDLLFTHYDPHFRHGHDALSEIYWPYDRYARPTIPGLFLPVAANVFGAYEGSQETWAEFAEFSRRLSSDGRAGIRVERY